MSRAIRVTGTPDGQAHFTLIENGIAIRTRPIARRVVIPEFEDTFPTQPADLDEAHQRTGRHNYPPPDWELKWTKRFLFAAIVITVGLTLLAVLV